MFKPGNSDSFAIYGPDGIGGILSKRIIYKVANTAKAANIIKADAVVVLVDAVTLENMQQNIYGNLKLYSFTFRKYNDSYALTKITHDTSSPQKSSQHQAKSAHSATLH